MLIQGLFQAKMPIKTAMGNQEYKTKKGQIIRELCRVIENQNAPPIIKEGILIMVVLVLDRRLLSLWAVHTLGSTEVILMM